MVKLIIAIVILSILGLCGCHSKASKGKQAAQYTPARKLPAVEQKHSYGREHIAQMTFVEYLDDGDYFQILARKGDSTFSFVNDTDTSRNINRGDPIQVRWKDSTITVAGDNDAEMPAQILLEVKKIGSGPVSDFRKAYGKKLKYTWAEDEELTSSYLDKVYLIVEYYLTQTKNPLLLLAVKNKDELTYSIESKKRDDHDYRVIGIATVSTNGSHIVQWLYVDEEFDNIYEYNLPEDKLIKFN